MSCFICGRGNCCPPFHPIEEQKAYDKAEEAFEKFLQIREQCRIDYEESNQEDVEDE